MSTQKGNISRIRPQKYQNKTKFKNDLHDKSHITKKINKIEVANVCSHCKGVIEWKIKFKKYKPLKNPSTCVSCHNKNVKHAYHTLCINCSTKMKVCPKCGKEKELVESKASFDIEEFLKTGEAKSLMQPLSERKRRMMYRLLEKSEENDLCTKEKILQKLESLQLDCCESNFPFNNSDDDDNNKDSDLSNFDF